MSDFVGRLLREPGPRLRPLLPNVFDVAAPRLQTGSDPISPAFVEERLPPLGAAQVPHASRSSAPGPRPRHRHERATMTEEQVGQEPGSMTAPGPVERPQVSAAAGATPNRTLPPAAPGTKAVTEGPSVLAMRTGLPEEGFAPLRAPMPQADAGLPLDDTPGLAGLPQGHFPRAPATYTEPGSDGPIRPSSPCASGIPTGTTIPLASDTPTRATATPGAVGTGDRQVVVEPEDRSSPKNRPKAPSPPTPNEGQVDGSQGAVPARLVMRSEARGARTRAGTASARRDRPSSDDERVPPVVKGSAAADPLRRGWPVSPAVRPGAPGALVCTSHPVRPAVAPLGAAAPPGERRAPGATEAAEPVVRITIDRLEIRAAPPPAAAPRSSRRRPQLSLDEYLRGRT